MSKVLKLIKEICNLILENPDLPTITKIKSRNGYLQHYTLKNLKGLYATKETKTYKKCNLQQLSGEECKKIEEAFNKIQNLISEIIENLKVVVADNPDKYQSQISKLCGFGDWNDNNMIIATFMNIMIEHNIIEKIKKKNRVYFKILDPNKKYKKLSLTKNSYASSLEKEFAGILAVRKIDFETQVSIPNIKEEKDNVCNLSKCRIDFKINIKNIPIYVEIDGRQHFEFVKFFQKTYKNFIKQINRDQKVNEYFKKENINLLRIRYDENMENKFDEFINKIQT